MVPTQRIEALLAHAAELEERDADVAAQLDVIDALAGRTAVVRERAAEVQGRLEAFPTQHEVALSAVGAAEQAESEARQALDAAEEHVASLGRRRRQDERDQAERELTRATEAVHDAGQRRERAARLVVELDELRDALTSEAASLVAEARAIADAIRPLPRVAEAGKGESGTSLVSVEEWGARVRAALFVARGTLAGERERIVVEANTLGSSVLGEPLGGSSVSLVRRRLEQHLSSTG